MTMQGEELKQRLAGIQKSLMGLFYSGVGLSSASRGQERERFIDLFLCKVLPPGYRFGTGEAIDSFGYKSGQLDVVVEFTFFPSLAAFAGQPRLYFAEGVAAVIEVKSNLAKQWKEVQNTSSALRPLQRLFKAPGFTPFGPPSKKIPIFAIGYKGWKDLEIVKRKANEGIVDGILIIEQGLFSTSLEFPNGMYAQGPFGLWGLICSLHFCALSIVINSVSPIEYVRKYIS
jgi:hypothetical protein